MRHISKCFHLSRIEVFPEMGDLPRFAFTPFNNPHPNSHLIMTTFNKFLWLLPILKAKVVPNYYLIDNIDEIIRRLFFMLNTLTLNYVFRMYMLGMLLVL